MKKDVLTVHSDGGSRGNPGPAACAFVFEQDSKILAENSKFLGNATNNVAEYSGVLLFLKWIESQQNKGFDKTKIVFYMDSELVVNQLNGVYKIKNQTLKQLATNVKKKILENKLDIKFVSVLRANNKMADRLVNQELDKNT